MNLSVLPPNRRQFLAASLAACSLPALPTLLQATGSEVTPSNKDVPWLEEIQRRPAKLPENAPTLQPLLVDSQGKPITTLDGWNKQRDVIRQWWLDFLRPLKVDRKQPPALKVLSEDRTDGVIRQLVEYEVEPGIVVEAYLLKPLKIDSPRPGVVALHSTVDHSIRQPAGVEGVPEKFFGLKLAQRGYVTFCPRNFLWPTNHKISANEETKRFHDRHPQSKGMAKMLLDSQIAVDILAGLPEVDAKRLGAVGHSLGAKEAFYIAALDERIQVAVSSEGGIGTKFSNWDAPWYLGDEIRKPEFTREHHELLALCAPRPFLLLGGDSADGDRGWPFIEAALPVYQLYGTPPRLGQFNHKQGHAVPPEAEKRIYEWIETYLPV
jgi:dienelactone hydrolase